MKFNRPLISVAGLVLAACGSSGGDDVPPVVSPPASVTIDSNNAPLVAKLSYEAALDSGDLGDLGGSIGLVASGPAGVSKLDGAIAAAAKSGSGNSGSSVPIPAERVMCAVDGFVTVSGAIADPFTPKLGKGDFFEFLFEICDEGTGEITDGQLRADVNSFGGDLLSGLYELGMTFRLTMFQVAEGTEVFMSEGDVTVSLDALNLPYVATSISGVSITIDGNTNSETLTNYSTDVTFDGNFIPAPYTLVASGTLDSSELSGAITYSAVPVTMFEGFEGEYPHTGELLVEGDSSALRLVAENNVDVTIYIDSDGNGIFDDQIISTTWVALTN